VFNFHKPQLNPISSFILYSIGGDAEDLWHVYCKKLSNHSFELTKFEGHYNDISTKDTTFIDQRKVTKLDIDKYSGHIQRTLLRKEINIIETK